MISKFWARVCIDTLAALTKDRVGKLVCAILQNSGNDMSCEYFLSFFYFLLFFTCIIYFSFFQALEPAP